MRIALTRAVPDTLNECALTHLERTVIDPRRATLQHEAYEHALRTLGCTVVRLPATPDLPDSVFVEDTAIVLDELAIVTRPGAPSRQAETTSVAPALARYRPVQRLEPPAALDGGDVLRLGRTLYIGLSGRTNRAGIDQLARLVEPFGYVVESVTVRGCLHLKSAATPVDDDQVLCNPEWIPAGALGGARMLTVDPSEPSAANVLRVGDGLICAAAHERTMARLAQRGYAVHPVDVSELARAEGGVTCCSLIIAG